MTQWNLFPLIQQPVLNGAREGKTFTGQKVGEGGCLRRQMCLSPQVLPQALFISSGGVGEAWLHPSVSTVDPDELPPAGQVPAQGAETP